MSRIRTLLVALVLVASAFPAFGLNYFFFSVERGGQTAISSFAGTTTQVMRSYTSATVYIYDRGTSTLATDLYQDSGGTLVYANPATSNSLAELQFYGGATCYTVTFAPSGVSSWTKVMCAAELTNDISTLLPAADTQTIVKGSADATKLLRFEVDGFTTGSTRVITPPNSNTTIPIFAQQATFNGLTAARTYTLPDADSTLVATTGNVATATALAADPTDCAANQVGISIAASGNLGCVALTDAYIPDTITISLAATATALAADPTDCAANQFGISIAASGNLGCAALTDADIPNTITIDNATNSTNSTNVVVVDSTDATSFIAMFDTVTGTQQVKTDAGLTYDATTANLSATTFTGALSGNASTATALAANPADCGANTFANAIAASGALTCAEVPLTDATSGNYVATVTGGAGMTGSGAAEGSTPTLDVVSANGGIVANADNIALTVAPTLDALSATTSSGSGLEILATGLAILQGCANGQILKWVEASDIWQCSADDSAGAPTFDTIGDAAAATEVLFDDTETVTMSGASDGETFWKFNLTDATLTGATVGVSIVGAPDNDANFDPFQIWDDGAGTPDKIFEIDHTGAITTGTIATTGITGINAGTDITADLEEETHASEHAVGGADTVFAADPNANKTWTWDDTAGAGEWGTMSDFSYSGTAWTVVAADTTTAGKVELATAAETTTGTDAGRGVTPDGLAGSDFGKRIIELKIIDDATTLTTGDGKLHFFIPSQMNGHDIVDVDICVSTVSSSGTPTVQIASVTDSVDILSTSATIDANEKCSFTAATAPVINGANDSIATGEELRIDVDVAGTGAKGLTVIIVTAVP